MSQQKVFLAVAVVACFAALVAAQSWDMNACQKAVQDSMDQYSKGISQSISQFSSTMSQQALGAVPQQQLQEHLDTINQSVTNMASISQGFDGQRMMNSMTQIVQAQMAIARIMMNPSTGMKMFSSWMKMQGDLYSANTNLIQAIPAGCMPRTI